jgi:hypothetical protein
MTKLELIYAIKEKLKISNSDAKFTNEYFSFLVDNKRAMLIEQRYGQAIWKIPVEAKQQICLDLEVVDSIEGETCFGKILRTKSQLPVSAIAKKAGPLAVRNLDRIKINLNIVPMERLPFVGHNTATDMLTYVAVDVDRRLYFVSKNSKHYLMESIKVDDVFSEVDDAEALICNPTGSENCDVWERDYPATKSMADDIINIIVKELVPTLGIPEDKTNDSQDKRG